MRSDRRTQNFGSASRLEVDNSPVIHSLLKFAVSGVGAGSVTSAKLRLYNVNSSSMGGRFYRVANTSWSESAVTWQSAPPADTTPLASLGAVNANRWYEVDLTSLITGNGTYSLRVTSTSSNDAEYRSKEASAGFRPQLVLSVTAPPRTLTVTRPGGGTGKVTSSPAGIDCGSTCQAAFEDGSTVTLSATPDPGSVFVGWGGACGGTGQCSISMTGDRSVTAAFEPAPSPAPRNLTVTKSGGGTGTVTSSPTGIDCGSTCQAAFEDGTTVTLSAAPDPGSVFAGWGGACGGTGQCSVSMTGDRSVTAAFEPAPSPTSEVVFSAAGDHGAGSEADASLGALDRSGSDFYLALGDLDYDDTPTDAAWCDYVKAHLPTLGPEFPFQLVSGNHEQQGAEDGYIVNHAACLPDRLGSTLSPTNQYAAEYYFDYPASSPLVRVIMIAPNLTIENVSYDYDRGNAHYAWLSGAIDDARSGGVPWVVVGMHENCLSMGAKSCSIGSDLMNLLIEKRVDLVLQGHDHNYQRSKQLALNDSTCPAVSVGAYDPDCVADDGFDNSYTKGQGSVLVIDGTFGQGLYPVNGGDPEAPYFSASNATTWGFTKYVLSSESLVATFVPSAGTFTESFTISSQPGGSDETPPTATITSPANDATVSGTTSVQVSASDDIGVSRVEFFIDGALKSTDFSAPYSYPWDTTTVANGEHALLARAYDPAGNVGSSSVTVRVDNSGLRVLAFSPVADTFVQQDSPSSNYGTSSRVEIDNSPVAHGLMRFTVTGIGTQAVNSAKLRLYCINESSKGGDFYRVLDNSWGETAVTWQTSPAAEPALLASLGSVASGTWYEVDLSSLVTHDGTYSLRIASTSSNGADYTSKEGTAGFAPSLVVTLGSP